MHRLVVALVLAIFAPAIGAQDPVKIDPAHHKVELETPYVRVLRITFGPGEKAPLHEHPGGVAIFMTDHQSTVMPEGGKPDPTPRKRGQIILTQASKHTVENPGPGKSEVVLVEVKSQPPAGTLADDAVKVDPKHYTVEAENDQVRVLRIRYGPGEKSVMHQHWPGASVSLLGGSVKFTDKTGKSMDESMEPGDVGEQTMDPHLPENTGKTPIEVILVEVKPKGR